MNGAEILDPRALERLRDWGGDKLLRQMVRIFLDNSPVRMAQIRQALNGGDIREAERAAHSLKSSAANLGAEELRALASALEQAAATSDPHATSDRLRDLEGAYGRVVTALEELKRGFSS